MYATEEQYGWPSIETYQTCELLTYSEGTLKAFLKNLTKLEADGIHIVQKIQENSVFCMGYKSLDAAERDIAWQMVQQNGGIAGCPDGCCI